VNDATVEPARTTSKAVSRREALRTFSTGVVGLLFAAAGLASARSSQASSVYCCHLECQPAGKGAAFRLTSCSPEPCPELTNVFGAHCRLVRQIIASSCTDC